MRHDRENDTVLHPFDRVGQFREIAIVHASAIVEIEEEPFGAGVVHRVDDLGMKGWGEVGAGGHQQAAFVERDDDDIARNRPVSEAARSEEHTSELQSLMRTSYAVLCLKKKT